MMLQKKKRLIYVEHARYLLRVLGSYHYEDLTLMAYRGHRYRARGDTSL